MTKEQKIESNNTMNEMKNRLEGINSKIAEAEEWISDLEDKMVEITSEEQNKVTGTVPLDARCQP